MSDPQIVRLSLAEARQPTEGFMPRFAGNSVASSQVPPVSPAPDLHAAGFAEGLQAAEARHAAERLAWQRLFNSAQVFQPEPSEELAAMIATIVERLVGEMVDAVPVDHARLSARIDHALSFVGEADAARTLWLHPADVALIDESLFPLEVHSDPHMERGALRIDCSTGWIEDSRSVHLDALRATLGIGAAS